MLRKTLILKNPRTEQIKFAPLGFSWTFLLFGFCVPFYRRDWLWGIPTLIGYIMTFGLISIPLAFIYNKYYARSLFKKGYKIFQIRGKITPKDINKILGIQNMPVTRTITEKA